MTLKGSSFSAPSVSIVIPVFDQKPGYLNDAVESAIARFDGVPFEIIVCDDGSDPRYSGDYSLICDRSGVTLFKLYKNMGMNAARNFAALQARGEYIALLDSDDVFIGEWDKVVEAVLRDQPRVAFGDHSQYNADLTSQIQKRYKRDYFEAYDAFRGTIFDPFLHCTFLFHPQIYRRELFISAGGFDCRYSSGDEIALQLKMLRGASDQDLMYFPGEHYMYRKNPDSVVHTPKLYEDLISNIEKIISSEFWIRHHLEVDVARHGRETKFGAAHYLVQQRKDGSSISLPWFDNKNLTFIDRQSWQHLGSASE